MPKQTIGYARALRETLAHIQPGLPVSLPVTECEGCVTAEAHRARVDSPSANTSLKDGYALRAQDGERATGPGATPLPVVGTVAAGQSPEGPLESGTAWRILTGARLPEGADTVVAEEFASRSGDHITIDRMTAEGRNILPCGSDTAAGELLVDPGVRLTPGRIGLLTAGGRQRVTVYPKPAVALVATGDEVLLPGQPLSVGKLYASNLLTLNGWCRQFGFATALEICRDNADDLRADIQAILRSRDALVTSGGAWTGDKDLVARVLDDLGWQKIYHRVRLGPGKAVGFGLLDGKPVFILPGGPPSNLVAFLLLALQGLQRLAGIRNPGLPEMPVVLQAPVAGQRDWTQVLFGTLRREDSVVVFQPDGRPASRLKSMATADALLLIPEGIDRYSAKQDVTVQLLDRHWS